VHQATFHLINKWSHVNVFFSKNKQFAWRVNYGQNLKLGETKILNDAKRIKRYNYLLYWKLSLFPFKKVQPSISLFKLQV
jgi:hypothetical protein